VDEYGTYVRTLTYKVVVPDHFKYENAPPVEFDTREAHARLADGELVLTLKQDHSQVPAAQDAVAPILEAWQAMADLQYTPGEFRFKFDRPEFAFRHPPPAGVGVAVGYIPLANATLNAVGQSSPPPRRTYPDPPIGFVLSPDAQVMHDRIVGSILGREPIASMAYFCLTVVESLVPPTAQGRKRRCAAAAALGIESAVLNMIGDLSSEHGAAFGRKAAATKPLTSAHQHWLTEATRALFIRVGAHASGTQLPQLTMADLPQL
jgi:hypothetical protein